MTPTRIYVASLLALFSQSRPKGLAHITGGGLTENIPRMLPPGLGAVLESSHWQRPAIFDWLSDAGVETAEMHRTFNCGVGMVAVVSQQSADDAIETLVANGETAWRIGEVVRDPEQRVVIQ